MRSDQVANAILINLGIATSPSFDPGSDERRDRIASIIDDAMTPAVRSVLSERERQKSAEGWTPEHDDTHRSGEMARAAASYAAGGGLFKINLNVPLQVWPYQWEWKPTNTRRDLEKAGALILAEIERLDRRAAKAALNPKERD